MHDSLQHESSRGKWQITVHFAFFVRVHVSFLLLAWFCLLRPTGLAGAQPRTPPQPRAKLENEAFVASG